MFEIDGSKKSGSGTLLRLSIALAAIKSEPLHIFNIRQNRPNPGLKPQHLESVITAAKLSNAQVEGAKLGSRELYFYPGKISGGDFEAEIGTAGSIPMLFMSVLPICLFARKKVKLSVAKGGTDTINAPTINYLKNIYLPALKQMGIDAEIIVHSYGYYPKGMGSATLKVEPSPKIYSFYVKKFGQIERISGISVCTFLSDRNVAQRQAKAASEILSEKGYNANISVLNDKSNVLQKGSSIVIWVQTTTGAILGADAIGGIKKSSETVGREAASKLLDDLFFKPTVDVNLADMLIPFIGLTNASSLFFVRNISEHIDANIWLVEKMLNVQFKVEKYGSLYKIQKLAAT